MERWEIIACFVLCSPDWPGTHDPHVSASLVTGLMGPHDQDQLGCSTEVTETPLSPEVTVVS